jgi:hypothetical protein
MLMKLQVFQSGILKSIIIRWDKLGKKDKTKISLVLSAISLIQLQLNLHSLHFEVSFLIEIYVESTFTHFFLFIFLIHL